MNVVGIDTERNARRLSDHGVPFAGFEERQHRLAAVGGDLEWTALEASGPKVVLLDRFEPEVLLVPRGRLGSVGHADVYVVEPAHAERARVGDIAHRQSPLWSS